MAHALVFDPLDFMDPFCALVVPPRCHLVHSFGVFGPNSSWRAEIVPSVPPGEKEGQAQLPLESEKSVEAMPGRQGRLQWAELMKRTFAIYGLACECGGRKRFIGFVFDPGVLAEIGRSLGQVPLGPTPQERSLQPADLAAELCK